MVQVDDTKRELLREMLRLREREPDAYHALRFLFRRLVEKKSSTA
jgi:hypothetical protein